MLFDSYYSEESEGVRYADIIEDIVQEMVDSYDYYASYPDLIDEFGPLDDTEQFDDTQLHHLIEDDAME